jgi:3',5'-cyclic AMP phosphodiesterase CpdA
VIVTDPLGGTCSGTAPSGSCTYTPTDAGVRTITAQYRGSADFARSSGTAQHTVSDAPPPQSVTMVGAGDVHAKCVSTNQGYNTAALVSDVLAADPKAIAFTIGDNAGIDGTTADFACYHKSWGAFKSRTKLVMGNHERRVDGAAKAYYDYGNGVGVDSGPVGRRGKGYYAFTHGSWRILVLNSEQAQAEQAAWIKADIAAHPTKCQLALFHKFLFTSGSTVNPVAIVRPFWQALYAKGVDVILNAHDHTYQRYAKMRWDGVRDPLGIREFISGTGGGIAGSLRATPLATNEKMLVAFGVLKLNLFADRYEWQFIDIAGTVRDSGSDTCH